MPETNKSKSKSLMVTEDTHHRVLLRKFKRQSDTGEEVSMDDIVNDLLDQTENKKLKKVS